jgi:hypothetical protein
MAKKQAQLINRMEVIRIRLGDIQQQDGFTKQLLGNRDYKSDFAGSPEMWAHEVLEISVLSSPLILVKRASGYQYLGSGLKLHLMQRFLGPEDDVWALLYKAKSVSNEFKLNVLASEILLTPSIYRTTRFRPWQHLVLCELIEQAGGTPIAGEGAAAFAAATGYSANSLIPPEDRKSRPSKQR